MSKQKQFFSKYKHAWVLSYFIIYMLWFTYLEKRNNVEFYSIHMTLDDMIPFCEYFIIPYMLWFLYIAGTVLYFMFTDVKDFYKCCAMLFTGMTICLIIYTVFPNQQNLRPTSFANDSIFIRMVASIYAADTATNVCPSIHVLNSLCAFFSICESKRLRKHKLLLVFTGILSISICMSTVFLKQHSFFDVLCGTGLAILLYALVYHLNLQKISEYITELKEVREKKKADQLME